MRVISINTNGIRAAARKGFFDWLPRQRADVVCVQETKAQVDQLDQPLFHPKNSTAATTTRSEERLQPAPRSTAAASRCR